MGASPNEDSLKKSQRDFVPKPRVARHELPWENVGHEHNPNGVKPPFGSGMGAATFILDCLSFAGRNPVGVVPRRVDDPG